MPQFTLFTYRLCCLQVIPARSRISLYWPGRCNVAQFTLIPKDAAKAAVLPPGRAFQERYRQYLRDLGPDSGGQLVLEAGDKPITERARLKAAAQAEGIHLNIQRRGNTMVFWQTDEPPKARAKASTQTS